VWQATTSFVPECSGIVENEEDRYVHKTRCRPRISLPSIRAPVLAQLSKTLLESSKGVLEWLNLGGETPATAADRGEIASLEWLNLDQGGQRRRQAAFLY